MIFNLNPILETETILLQPLREEDFEELYQAASDPKTWEQHPNQDRWKKMFSEISLRAQSKVRGHIKLSTKKLPKLLAAHAFMILTKIKIAFLSVIRFTNPIIGARASILR